MQPYAWESFSKQPKLCFLSYDKIKCFQCKAYVNSQICGLSHAAIYEVILMGWRFHCLQTVWNEKMFISSQVLCLNQRERGIKAAS